MNQPIVLDSDVQNSIKNTLEITRLELKRTEDGTNDRTFFAHTDKGEFVVRIERGEGVQLRRAYAAQERARSLGVRVPQVIAHNFEDNHAHDWIVEEKINGEAFYPDRMEDEQKAIAISRDLGRQLKILHTVPCDLFGLIPPFPYTTHKEWQAKESKEFQEETTRNGPVFSTFAERMDSSLRDVEPAFALAGISRDLLPKAKGVYQQLKELYSGPPIFGGGDTAMSNLVVADGEVKALIDWEWAQAHDPARNVAYWSYWNRKKQYLDYFLEGYQPQNLEAFKNRVRLFEVVTGLHLIQVFHEQGQDRWIIGARERIETSLTSL